MRRNNPFAESPSDRLNRGAFAAWRKEGFLMSRRAKLLALTLAMLGLLGVATAAQAGNQLFSGWRIIRTRINRILGLGDNVCQRAPWGLTAYPYSLRHTKCDGIDRAPGPAIRCDNNTWQPRERRSWKDQSLVPNTVEMGSRTA